MPREHGAEVAAGAAARVGALARRVRTLPQIEHAESVNGWLVDFLVGRPAPRAEPRMDEITPQDLKARLTGSDRPCLLDVRQDWGVSAGWRTRCTFRSKRSRSGRTS